MSSYIPGQIAKLTVTFSQDSVAVDPTTVAIKIKKPDETVATYSYPASITKSAVGSYAYSLDLTTAGTWWYRWYSTGVGQTAVEGSIEVSTSHVV